MRRRRLLREIFCIIATTHVLTRAWLGFNIAHAALSGDD